MGKYKKYSITSTLPHSVMVARQNLTLLVHVRIMVRQQLEGWLNRYSSCLLNSHSETIWEFESPTLRKLIDVSINNFAR